MKYAFILTGLTTLAVLGLTVGSASAQTPISATNPFTAGDLVVSQINVSGANSTAQTVTLDEFTTAASQTAPVATLNVTGTAAGSNPFSVPGSSGAGLLHLSGNNDYLTIGGYDTTAGTASVSGTTVPREAAIINSAGNVDTSTLLKEAYSASSIRSVYSPDGENLYTGGSNGTVSGGVWLTQDGNTDPNAPTAYQEKLIESKYGAVQDVAVSGNNLYFTSQSSGGIGVYEIAGTSTSLPTSKQTPTLVADTANDALPVGLYVDSSGNIWVADQSTNGNGGLYEYTSATSLGSDALFVKYSSSNGLTGLTDNNGYIYATTTSNYLVDYMIGSGSSGAFTKLSAQAPAGDEFEGVSFAPAGSPSPAPEPSEYATLGLIALGLGALVFRARKRALAAV